MEQLDYNHCLELEQLEELIEEMTDRLVKAEEEESDLEIIIIEELDNYPEIKDSLSPKNKYIRLRTMSDNPDVKKWVKDWIIISSLIRRLKHKLRQVEGKRDSKKKIFNVLPK